MSDPFINVFSNLDSSILLHRIVVLSRCSVSDRVNCTESSENLQVSCIPLKQGSVIRAHGHRLRDVNFQGLVPLEVWVLAYGRLSVDFFETDGSPIRSEYLNAGDLLISFSGGHALEALEPSQLVEIKQGPYLGKDIYYFNE